MNNLYKWSEEWITAFTLHQVEKLKETPKFNENHIAKVLVWHIETLKIVIDNLLENGKN